MKAATISMVLKVAPEIYRSIEYLIKNGELDEKQFQKIGLAALQGGAEGFVRGSVSAAITVACRSGSCGEGLKNVNPAIVGAVTVIAMNTMKNSFRVVQGDIMRRDLVNELIKEMFVSSCSLITGGISQAFIELPVIGFMIGSFVGSIVGSFAYEFVYSAVLTFCAETGFTMFGLVDQNYELLDDVMEAVGFEIFEYEKFNLNEFQHDEFSIEEFSFEKFEYETLSIVFLSRGVIGVSQIGYV